MANALRLPMICNIHFFKFHFRFSLSSVSDQILMSCGCLCRKGQNFASQEAGGDVGQAESAGDGVPGEADGAASAGGQCERAGAADNPGKVSGKGTADGGGGWVSLSSDHLPDLINFSLSINRDSPVIIIFSYSIRSLIIIYQFFALK